MKTIRIIGLERLMEVLDDDGSLAVREQSEVAELLGISRHAVSYHERSAKEKIAHAIRELAAGMRLEHGGVAARVLARSGRRKAGAR
jgi:hypothetical protein